MEKIKEFFNKVGNWFVKVGHWFAKIGKDLYNKVKNWIAPPKDSHYISNKESRRIARENMKIIKEYEAEKRRKDVPE